MAEILESIQLENNKDNVIDLFGSKAFNLTVMRKRLPKHVYNAMLAVMKEDKPLEKDVAEVVANRTGAFHLAPEAAAATAG